MILKKNSTELHIGLSSLPVRPWIPVFRNTAVWLAIGPPGNIAIKKKIWQIKVCGEESRG